MAARLIRARPADRGTAVAEFALVLPVLLLLVLGCVDWGWYFFVDQIVTNAAREGARAGSVVDPAPANAGLALDRARGAAELYLQRAGLAAAGISVAQVTVGTVPAIEVSIALPVGTGGSLTGFLAPFIPDNAAAKAVMRWQ